MVIYYTKATKSKKTVLLILYVNYHTQYHKCDYYYTINHIKNYLHNG